MNNPKRNFCLSVWGELAAFNRSELKIERVSYDVITPSAARAIFTAVFWKPAIRWHITKIEVLNPIRTISIRKNEVAVTAGKGKNVFIEDFRQQKAGICLRDVAYRLYADLEYLPPEQRVNDKPNAANGPETPTKYFEIFERRASKGQFFHQPYFGTRECVANFRFIPEKDLASECSAHPSLSSEHDRDFGIMLFDLDFSDQENPVPMFYHASMRNGVVEVPSVDSAEVLR